MEEMGLNPRKSNIRLLLVGGEPGTGVKNTRNRLQGLWDATMAEFYGCTEVSPHCGGYSCPASDAQEDGTITTHLMEDIQIWELVDADTKATVEEGQRGLTVCTSLNSESSPQLRFLIGDYTSFNKAKCPCGRSHVRAVGSFSGRADDLINLRGIKMYPIQIEEAVRSIDGIGDEYEIVLKTNKNDLDIMSVRVEHAEDVNEAVQHAIRTHCEIRSEVEILKPGTLPKTEFKANRVRDERNK